MRMRLVSYNFQNRRGEPPAERQARCERCAAFLKYLKPDVVGLQEVTPDAWKELHRCLGEPASVYLPRVDGQHAGEGTPLFCLNNRIRIEEKGGFWFSETPDVPSLSWRAAHPRVCAFLQLRDPVAGSCWLFNLHLDHKSRAARRNSLRLLRERIEEVTAVGERIVVVGDFNMPGYRKEIRSFLDGDPLLVDATRFHPVGALRPTFLGWGPFRLAKARIDLCLHTKGLRADRYQAVHPEWEDEVISDHRAVVVDLSPVPSPA
jgi:endonuclease/exonuclease/phosphatase family metal-dependent hydrolase